MRKSYIYRILFAFILSACAYKASLSFALSPAPEYSESVHQNQALAELYAKKQSDQFLTVQGKVYRILKDDTKGRKHQRFLMYVDNISVLVAHNTDLAPRVPIQLGDIVTLRGEYEYNDKGGVMHWTHHNPKPNGLKFGWIEHKNKRYQ